VEILIGLCFLGGMAIFGLVFCIAIVMLIRRLMRSPTSGGASPFAGMRAWMPLGNLLTNGTPARAILLAVDSTGTRTAYYGQRCEVRGAYIDIEVPGVPPYEMQTSLYIPTNLVRDALPGSTMEIRIDPSNQNKVLVVGPDVGYTQGAVRTS
jgi:hypothetical protein